MRNIPIGLWFVYLNKGRRFVPVKAKNAGIAIATTRLFNKERGKFSLEKVVKSLCDRYVFICLAALLGFQSCEENRRMITPIVPEGNRIILLEEFTGKGCSNCPKGSREIENLLSLYGDNLVAVSIHAGFFANPDFFNIGEFDFRTEEGEALFDYLGPNSGYPAGVINRTYFNGEIQLISSAWASLITDALNQEPEVEFQVASEYDSGSGNVSVTVKGISRANIEGDLRVSVMLTESNVIDAQDDIEAGGVVGDYNHKHIMRDMLTKFDGESFASQLIIGDDINLSFSGPLDNSWVPSEMEVIAFISNVGADGSFEVLQAGSTHLQN